MKKIKKIKKIRKVCSECGSTDVRVDAWASWDETNQQWELAESYDNSWCIDCEGECTIDDEEIKEMITYSVDIREVHISTREVTVSEDIGVEEIIRLGLDAEEVEMEFSHTMAYHHHTIRKMP